MLIFLITENSTKKSIKPADWTLNLRKITFEIIDLKATQKVHIYKKVKTTF